ncbi:MAG: class I adenylate-forming enzyme family protein [Gemmatimonadaceae bacterium]
MLERQNLGDILRLDAPEHTQFIDLRESDRLRTWTVAALAEAIDAVARGCLRRGLTRGDRVAILAENRAEFLVAYFGVMRAGLVAVPVNHRLTRQTVEFILKDAAVRMVLADAPRLALVPPKVPLITMDGDGHDSLERLMDWGPFHPVIPHQGEIAKILYTSGSTGRPKGVPLAHDGQLWAVRDRFHGGAQGLAEKTVIVAPTYHKNGLFFSMVALSNGYTVASLPRFEARSYLETVARYRCTLLSGIPTMFALMARESDLIAELDLSSVRMVTIGSAPLTQPLIDRVRAIFPNAALQNGYGTTEAGPGVFGAHPGGLPRPALSLGFPLQDIQWRLADGPSPDQGVLHLRTPALMQGYLNLPDVTASRIRDGWYDTGDIMRRDASGFFYFVGRADDMFVCGGENVYPGEVEQLLERHTGVAQAAVVAVPDEIKGQIPVAFIVRAAESRVDEAELKAYALREGPAYSHPRFVVVKDVLPVASTHKIDRRVLELEALAVAQARGRGPGSA